jgi:hypothetical protein
LDKDTDSLRWAILFRRRTDAQRRFAVRRFSNLGRTRM